MNGKSYLFILLLLIVHNYILEGQNTAFKIPEKTKRILFLGNSITYNGQYVSYFEAYLRVKYPKKKFEIINVGLPSETVSGLSEANHADGRFPRPALQERLDRVLKQTKPDLVFASYGMNDGIYLPLDSGRFQKFKEGIIWLHRKMDSTCIPIVHLTPPIFDEQKGKEYAHVLDTYSDWLKSKRQSDNWEIADIHWPMKKFQENKRLTDTTFALAIDGVHPNEMGHWIMAQQLLLFIGKNEITHYTDANSAFSNFENGDKILKLVEERQSIMKDAWLTLTGHKRPEMKVGLPLKEAQKKANQIEKQIQNLLK